MITVKELKKKLEDVDENMIVVRTDNNMGCEDICDVFVEDIISNFSDDKHTKGKKIQVLVLE